MITISELVDPFQIRSVLTVSEADLPNEVLIGFGLEDEVADVLDSLVPTWSELVDPKQMRKLRLYSKYKAAAIVAVMAPVFILKKMSDGSNEGQRSDRDGFRWLSRELEDKANSIMEELLEDLGLSVTVEPFELVGRVTPERDPITEPRDDVSS
jgi:hypothetical protein